MQQEARWAPAILYTWGLHLEVDSSTPQLCLRAQQLGLGPVIGPLLSAEYWVGQDGLEQAWQLLQTMQELQVPIAPYIPATTVESVCKVRALLCMASSGLQVESCTRKQPCAFAAGHFAHGNLVDGNVGDNIFPALKGAGPGHAM